MASLPVAYLDNNATTLMPEVVSREMAKWINQGNPSASYTSAQQCQAMMREFREFIASHIGATNHDVVFTSGATEANCTVVRGVIERARRKAQPFHVVASAIEHKSILLMLEDLARAIPFMQITYVNPDSSGHIVPRDFARALRDNTCLAICMHGNNETGAINAVNAIGRAVKDYNNNIFFHCDIVQTFGKIPVHLGAANIDGASISFHKLHGPPGVGCFVVRRSMYNGVSPLLYGTQSAGMRGGTENIIAIGTAFAAARLVFAQQQKTITHELALKRYLVAKLAERVPVVTNSEYISARTKMELQVVIIADNSFLEPTRYLPATIMLAVAKHVGPAACNSLIKSKLEEARVIVSVGSACNTANKDRSHVLRAMNIAPVVMDGAIRVSMCGFTAKEELDRFIDGFIAEANRQYQKR